MNNKSAKNMLYISKSDVYVELGAETDDKKKIGGTSARKGSNKSAVARVYFAFCLLRDLDAVAEVNALGKVVAFA